MSLPALEETKAALEQAVQGAVIQVEGAALVVEAKDLAALCRHVKDDHRFRLDYLANLTAIDYPPDQLHVVYHLYSMQDKHGPLTLKVKLPRATPHVPSVTPIWRGGEFQEREVYDLYGVVFEGHPDLRRILMWDGFQGHPMRKDYVPEDQDAPMQAPPA